MFELNNRVPHRVANRGPGPRVHLVMDVYEEPKTRTRLPPGTTCAYGSPAALLQELAQLTEEAQEEEALAAQVQGLLGAAGMACTTKDGQRVMPKLPPSSLRAVEQTQQELLGLLEQQQSGQLDVAQVLAVLKRSMQGQAAIQDDSGGPVPLRSDPEQY